MSLVKLVQPIHLQGHLAGRVLNDLPLRPPSARVVRAMAARRLPSGGWTDERTVELAARLSGIGPAILRRLSTADLEAVSGELERLYRAARRRLAVRDQLATDFREEAIHG